MTQSEANKQLQEALHLFTQKYDPQTEGYVVDPEKIKEQAELIKIALDNGANPNEISNISKDMLVDYSELLLNHPTNPLSPQNFLEQLLSKYCSDSNFSQWQPKFIKIAMDKGANPNEIRNIPIDTLIAHSELLLNHPTNPLTQQKVLEEVLSSGSDSEKVSDLIKLAMDNGANPNEVWYIPIDTLIAHSELLMSHPTNPLSAQKLLVFAMQVYTPEPEMAEKQIKLIKIAIDLGADCNRDLQGEGFLSMAYNRDVAELLQRHGASCDYRFDDEIIFGGLSMLQWSPKQILEKKYKNLDAPLSEHQKMPYNMFHIWLTSPDSPREIRPQDMENAIKTKALFEQSSKTWEHVVWTNDLDLIPESVKKLNYAGIQVKSICDYQDDIELLNLVESAIESKKWGIASDTLRYGLINEFGGVYADINFIFNRDLVEETHKYNFFTMTYEHYYIDNFIFGASANHPIIKNILSQVERNLVNPPSYIADIEEQDSSIITDMATANPIYIAYYNEANKNGNVDVVYPLYHQRFFYEAYDARLGRNERVEYQTSYDKKYEDVCASNSISKQINEYLDVYEICAGETFNFGHDSPDGRTWID